MSTEPLPQGEYGAAAYVIADGHQTTYVIALEGADRYLIHSQDSGTFAEVERIVLYGLGDGDAVEPDPGWDIPWGCDLGDGLVLVGTDPNDDLNWIPPDCRILFDSTVARGDSVEVDP